MPEFVKRFTAYKVQLLPTATQEQQLADLFHANRYDYHYFI